MKLDGQCGFRPFLQSLTFIDIHSNYLKSPFNAKLVTFDHHSFLSLGCRKLCSKSSRTVPKSGRNSWIWRDNWRRMSCASGTVRRTTCRSNISVPKKRLRRYLMLTLLSTDSIIPYRKTAAESSFHFSVLYSCLGLSFTPLQDRVTVPSSWLLSAFWVLLLVPAVNAILSIKSEISRHFGTKLCRMVHCHPKQTKLWEQIGAKPSDCILKLLLKNKHT